MARLVHIKYSFSVSVSVSVSTTIYVHSVMVFSAVPALILPYMTRVPL